MFFKAEFKIHSRNAELLTSDSDCLSASKD